MALPWMFYESKSTKNLRQTHLPFMKLLYSESCTFEAVQEYGEVWKAYNKKWGVGLEQPCLGKVPLKCCQHFSKIVQSNKRMVILALKYSFTGFSQGHSALAEFLELDPKLDYPIGEPKLISFCAEPGDGDVWRCRDNTLRLMWTSSGICLAYNSPPISAIYQVQPISNCREKNIDFFSGIGNHEIVQ